MSDLHCQNPECGKVLPPPRGPGRQPKWCSERCRKQGSYTGTCERCGGRTGWNGTATPSKLCADCGSAQGRATMRARADERETQVADLYRQGLPPRQIAARLNMTPAAIASLATRARRHGLNVPLARPGRPPRRERAAA